MNPVLVEITRGGIVESFHRGVVCVVDENDQVVYSKGDIQQVCFPRSALKFVQHIPLITSGIFDHYEFTPQELALMCGSHNGEVQHTDLVKQMLQKIGLTTDALKCGAQNPTRKSDWVELIKKGIFAGPEHNNCSGKHAGFLAYQVFQKESVDHYLSESISLQQRIKEVVARFAQLNPSDLVVGMDGCSAPTFAMPVFNQAILYRNLVSPSNTIPSNEIQAAHRVVKAVTEFPQMVAGTKRYCTDIMTVTKGRIVGKTGADGIYCLAIPDKKWGISIKVDDGKMGPQYQIAQALLLHLDLLTQEEIKQLDPYRECDLFNFAGNAASHTQTVPF